MAFCASVMVAAGSGGIANAAAGWDHVGSSTFKHRDVDSHLWFTGYSHSTGGSFKVCIDKTQFKEEITLWEQDSNGMKDVGKRSTKGGCHVFNGLGDYVDGSNKKAELTLSTTDAEGGGRVFFYD
ncbi:hypothetical protein GCM10010277_15370 [Streptomyces longisporoflavus]|nr:hypothetical protein GCM10010277_15370 [Streptomyces longisporoflavus]